MHRILPTLAFFSGVSGIAYEILYARLLGSYIGNMFYVSTTLLVTFFIGIAIGSFWSYNYEKKLPYIEIFLGVYALLMACVFQIYGLAVVDFVTGLPFTNIVNTSGFVFLILLLPATAIGFSVPLFSLYLKNYFKKNKSFDVTYILYNLGAATSAFLIEYLVIRIWGLSAGLMLFGLINFTIGLSLLFFRPVETESTTRWSVFYQTYQKSIILLFFVSIISGVIQAEIFNLYEFIIGPLNGNFAFIIGTILLGLSLAPAFSRLFNWSFSTILLLGSFTTLVIFSGLHFFILGYAYTMNYASDLNGLTYTTRILLNITFLSLTLLPVFIILGSTIPVLVRSFGEKTSGFFLGISSIGNAFGYLIFVFVLYENFGDFETLVLCSSLLYFGYFILIGVQPIFKHLTRAFFFMVIVSFGLVWWPAYLGNISFWDVSDIDVVASANRGFVSSTSYRKNSNQVSVVTEASGYQAIIHHGYKSTQFEAGPSAPIADAFKGVIPAFFAPEQNQALIIGLGPGVSASAAADYFNQVDVVEIYEPMIEVVGHFGEVNDNLLSKGNITITINDGIAEIVSGEKKYDAIINIVSSARYYSSGKLWTKEFFEAAKLRLNDGGVVAGRVSNSSTNRGLLIIASTLQASFKDCIYNLQGPEALVYVCSDSSLALRPLVEEESDFITTLLRENGWHKTVYELVKSTTFRPDETDTNSYGVNTIDKPLLDHNTFYEDRRKEHSTETAFFENYISALETDPFTNKKRNNSEYCDAVNFVYPGLSFCN